MNNLKLFILISIFFVSVNNSKAQINWTSSINFSITTSIDSTHYPFYFSAENSPISFYVNSDTLVLKDSFLARCTNNLSFDISDVINDSVFVRLNDNGNVSTPCCNIIDSNNIIGPREINVLELKTFNINNFSALNINYKGQWYIVYSDNSSINYFPKYTESMAKNGLIGIASHGEIPLRNAQDSLQCMGPPFEIIDNNLYIRLIEPRHRYLTYERTDITNDSLAFRERGQFNGGQCSVLVSDYFGPSTHFCHIEKIDSCYNIDTLHLQYTKYEYSETNEWITITKTPNCNISYSPIVPIFFLNTPLSTYELELQVARYPNKNTLRWQVLSNNANTHYNILRSKSGMPFEKVGTLSRSHDASTRGDYIFKDYDISSDVYYKIRAYNIDNTFRESNIVFVKKEQQKNQLSIYPNPNYSNELYVTGLESKTYHITIFNMYGNTVVTTAVTQDNNIVAINRLAGGVYFFQISSQVGERLFYNKLIVD